ncbi:MAG: CPBP family intramembrane glutamic endopeptidase [Rhodothermales bacterium]|nr:CPBP family intramembrane glutamic endopeptidase [Rhodothermales bacterium]
MALHLVPGVLLLAFYVIVAPPLRRAGFPSAFAFQLGLLFTILPWMLGVLAREGRRRAGRASLLVAVAFREPMPRWQVAVLGVVLFVWAVAVFAVVGPAEFRFVGSAFAWLPDWFYLNEDLSRYSQPVLIVTWSLALVLNGLAVPIVEELYFRGYLLPRMPGAAWVAVALHVVLFSAYHFFAPWQSLTRVLALVPLVAVVYWKRNVYVGMVAHAGLNLLGVLEALPDVLGQ